MTRSRRLSGAATAPAPFDPRVDVEDFKVPARGRYDELARRERLAWIRQRAGVSLEELEDTRLVAERLTGNIENAIGAVEIPVGLAGPLLFAGDAATGIVYAPFATTEGALVASASRGATALTRAGGVVTRVIRQRMSRAPVFELATPDAAERFAEWLPEQLATLREWSGRVSRHARLLRVEPVVERNVVHALFVYETGDAAGQNMTTATTWHACQWVLEAAPAAGHAIARFLIEGNLSADKKVNLDAAVRGRGCAVVADAVLDEETLLHTLKVSADDLVRAYELLDSGAQQVRMVSHNVNVANAVAAIFAATGQDLACVHESSLATLEVDRVAGGVHARVTFPGLVVGTVGGGTHLPAQRALLGLMGCTGDGTAHRLAEIIAGFALGLDLSTLAALASGEFASAHERLGRNRPVRAFSDEELTPAFFSRAIGHAVTAVELIASDGGASILSELTARRLGKRVGVVHRRLLHDGGSTDVVVKVKPLDAEVILMMQGMASACGRAVAETHSRFRADTGFTGCHVRELEVYAQQDPRFTAHAPRVYDTLRDDAREAFVLVLERLDARLMDTADDPSGWTPRDVEVALRGAGALHAIWMGRERELAAKPWIGVPPTARGMSAMRPLWDALAQHAASEFPALMNDAELRRHRELVARIPEWWARIEAMPRTLIHNDFNPRNIGIRDAADGPRLVAWDWELATIHLPQHDVAELLAFVLPPDASAQEVRRYVELHRHAVAEAGAAVPDARTWREGFRLAAQDLLVNRFGLYLMAHAFRRWGFMERSLATLRHLVSLDLEAR